MTFRSTIPSKPGSEAAERRARRLRHTVRAAGLWLLLQGLLLCVLNTWISDRVSVRYMELMLPYIRMAGLAYVCLAIYLYTAARSPQHQYLAVDLLILFLLGQSYFTLNIKLNGLAINDWELFSLLVNLALGTLLTLFRTRSTEMDPDAGTLWSLSAKAWIGGLAHGGRAAPAAAAMEAPRTETPAPKKAEPPAAPKAPESGPPKQRSESLPHLD